MESDLLSPGNILHLDPQERTQRLNEYIAERRKLKIKYVIPPSDPALFARVKFAQSLGDKVIEEQGAWGEAIYVCVFQDNSTGPNLP